MPSEEVTFYSGGCTIAGTFTEAADPVAAALLITGGGRSDRNSDARLPGRRMLRIGVDKAIACALAGARVCALRYDKRGVGASGGEYLRAGMDDRRADARAALGWLAARAGGLPLLAIGLSEGAWYAAELAADDAVAGAVLLGGGARPAEEILSWQSEMTAARLPATVRMILKITRTDILRSQRKRVARIKASTNDVIGGSRRGGDPGLPDQRPLVARLPRLRPAAGTGPHQSPRPRDHRRTGRPGAAAGRGSDRPPRPGPLRRPRGRRPQPPVPARPRICRPASLPPCGPAAGRCGGPQAHHHLDHNPLGRLPLCQTGVRHEIPVNI